MKLWALLIGLILVAGCSRHPQSKHYGPSFRLVAGSIMDTNDASKWGGILQESGFVGGGWTTYSLQTDSVFGDRVFCDIIRQHLYPETYTGILQVQSQETAAEIVIFNYPNTASLLTGQNLPDCICTRVQNYNQEGQQIIALDCGTDPNK